MENSAPTITVEFGLYCDETWKKGLLGSIFFLVALLSTLVLGVVSNKKGRWIATFISLFVGGLGSFLTGFVPSYWYAVVTYGLAGFLLTFLIFNPVMLNETGDLKFIELSAGTCGICWGVLEAVFVGIGYWL